jgi:hypothetical protein
MKTHYTSLNMNNYTQPSTGINNTNAQLVSSSIGFSNNLGNSNSNYSNGNLKKNNSNLKLGK